MERLRHRPDALWLALAALAVLALTSLFYQPLIRGLLASLGDVPIGSSPLLIVGLLTGLVMLVPSTRRRVCGGTLAVGVVAVTLVLAAVTADVLVWPRLQDSGLQPYYLLRWMPEAFVFLTGLLLTSALAGGGGRWWAAMALLIVAWAAQVATVQLSRGAMFEPGAEQRVLLCSTIYYLLSLLLCAAGGALLMPIGSRGPQPRWLMVALGALGGTVCTLLLVSGVLYPFAPQRSPGLFTTMLTTLLRYYPGGALTLFALCGAFMRAAIRPQERGLHGQSHHN